MAKTLGQSQIFNEEIARLAIQQIKESGVPVAEGLTSTEITELESLVGASIPSDLKELFSVGIPLSTNSNDHKPFPDWHNDLPGVVEDMRADIERAFTFDIEEDSYWHSSFGEKPENIDEAKKQAIEVIRSWPPLIRVYAHRFMPTSPSGPGNPVLSVWQATDTVYYGKDLADYLQNEFEITLPIKSPNTSPEVPFWGDAFDLKNER